MTSMHRQLRVLIGLLFILALLAAGSVYGAPSESIIYVNHDAVGNEDGSSWADAYSDLQDAIGVAGSGDEIWVAAGTYTPSWKFETGDPRYATFQMKNGVALYGGFDPSVGATELKDRDWEANPAILSGDIGVEGDDSDNSYHVIYNHAETELDSSAILDGFTITGGNANNTAPRSYGGGMYNKKSSPTVRNVVFVDNYGWFGGGMCNDGSSPTLTNVTFTDNGSLAGGGIHNKNTSRPTLTNVTFTDNWAQDGGGMHSWGSGPALTNVTFTGNRAWSGGGIYNVYSSPTLTNVVFSGNEASSDGGGGMYNENSNPALTNVTFGGNQAPRGGGVYNISYSNPALVNCILRANEAAEVGDEIYNDDSTPSISYSSIEGGCDATEGNVCGEGNIEADPLFVAPVPASEAPTPAGNYRLRYDSPAIDAGNTLSVTTPIDLDGNPRVVGAEVDMGAYEHQGYRLAIGTVGEGDVAEAPAWPTYTYLDQVVLTATARAGWTFAHWSGDVESSENPLTLVIQDDTDITATFTELPPGVYDLIVETVGNGSVTLDPPGGVYDEGTLVELTAEADPGWQFSGWSGDLSGTVNPESITMDGDKSVTATFTEVGENKIYLPLVVRND